MTSGLEVHVWINGFLLVHRPYGYVSIRYELTSHLNFGAGKSNVLAVRMDQSPQPASRYYDDLTDGAITVGAAPARH
ncbi:MAG: hypothetical protein ABSH22_08195 [Tepidisphaeraceae bacterium]|jgi:hypothetical protein